MPEMGDLALCDSPRPGSFSFTDAPRILLADDHPLVRSAVAQAALKACPGAQIVEVETLAEAIADLRKNPEVALILLDIRLPDSHDFNGLRTLRDHFPCIPIAIISALEDDLTIHGAMALGAAGFIPKSARMADLTAAITTIYEGGIWTPIQRATEQRSVSRLADAGLTPAQIRVMSGLKRGLLNKQIAFELGVTEHTVKAHMTAVFRKLGVTHRMQAMRMLQNEPDM